MIEAILAQPERQKAEVERLVRHIRELDGTEVRVIPISKAIDDEYMRQHPNAPFPCIQANGLRYCAKIMRGKPFFWLEPDAVPLKPGWLKALTKEYNTLRKPFLISSDSHPPNDLVGGIGFYAPETHWLIPDYFPSNGWDLWMLKHLGPMIGRTRLIQHSYGAYDYRAFCRPRIFPAEHGMIRPETLVFHRDKFHGLIHNEVANRNVFVHSGDLGDIIAALPVIRQLGGGRLVITDHTLTREQPMLRTMKPRMGLIEGLLQSQPYLVSVRFSDDVNVRCTHDFRPFRRKYRNNRTLTESQADWVGVNQVIMDPWLTVNKPSWKTAGRIVVARSARYHNPRFPWAKLVQAVGKQMLFIGIEEEHKDFCQKFGQIDWLPTQTLMEVAEAIAGSDLFIGNQSSPCWIAMGLGHPLVQETHETMHDSRVFRANAMFVSNGIIPGGIVKKPAVA